MIAPGAILARSVSASPRYLNAWLVALVGLVLFLPGPTASASGFPKHRCGSFVERTDDEGEALALRVSVFNGNHLPCRTAVRVIKAFFDPEGTVKSHGGPSEVQTYYTIQGFPGWRCYTGAGSGECIRHGRVAGYLNSVA